MTKLTASQRSAIRQSLEAERAGLLASVQALSVDDAHLAFSQSSGDARPRNEGDGDSVAVERHVVAQLNAGATGALAEVEEALARLDAGTYGLCGRCGQEIHPDRLEARPRSRFCVRCADGRR